MKLVNLFKSFFFACGLGRGLYVQIGFVVAVRPRSEVSVKLN